MSFKIKCDKCGNERDLEEIFELYPDEKEVIDITTNMYEEIILYCPKCKNTAKGIYE